jgi:predicted transposase YbfD/YdcC
VGKLQQSDFGTGKTSEKSNEITAIPELLESLFIKSCVVSIDAMGCQKNPTCSVPASIHHILRQLHFAKLIYGGLRLFFSISNRFV